MKPRNPAAERQVVIKSLRNVALQRLNGMGLGGAQKRVLGSMLRNMDLVFVPGTNLGQRGSNVTKGEMVTQELRFSPGWAGSPFPSQSVVRYRTRLPESWWREYKNPATRTEAVDTFVHEAIGHPLLMATGAEERTRAVYLEKPEVLRNAVSFLVKYQNPRMSWEKANEAAKNVIRKNGSEAMATAMARTRIEAMNKILTDRVVTGGRGVMRSAKRSPINEEAAMMAIMTSHLGRRPRPNLMQRAAGMIERAGGMAEGFARLGTAMSTSRAITPARLRAERQMRRPV
jgi:hypothetical protein